MVILNLLCVFSVTLMYKQALMYEMFQCIHHQLPVKGSAISVGLPTNNNVNH